MADINITNLSSG